MFLCQSENMQDICTDAATCFSQSGAHAGTVKVCLTEPIIIHLWGLPSAGHSIYGEQMQSGRSGKDRDHA